MNAGTNQIGVVLLSGGMDSCVTAAIAAQTHELALVHAGYGQRTERRERRAFDEIADFFEVPQDLRMAVRLEHFERIGGSALTDPVIRIPERGMSSSEELGLNSGTQSEKRNSIPQLRDENREE